LSNTPFFLLGNPESTFKAVVYKPRIINYANNTFTAYDSGWVVIVGDQNRAFNFSVPNYASHIDSSVNIVQFKGPDMISSDGWGGWNLEATAQNNTAMYTLRTGSAGVTKLNKPNVHAAYYRVRLLTSLADKKLSPLPDYTGTMLLSAPSELSTFRIVQMNVNVYSMESAVWTIPESGFYKFSLATDARSLQLELRKAGSTTSGAAIIGIVANTTTLLGRDMATLFDGYLFENDTLQITGVSTISNPSVVWGDPDPIAYPSRGFMGIIFTPTVTPF
jgi:hypothetical protein